LEQVILKALARHPDDRFLDAGALALRLEGNASSVGRTIPATARDRASSLLTLIERTVLDEGSEPMSSDAFPTPPPDVTQASIQIMEPQGSSLLMPIKNKGMTIGRSEGNDIVLKDGTVSEYHAQIQFDGMAYYVVDLDSTNGTFLGNTRLLPHVRETWRFGTPVAIGRSRLRLVPPAQRDAAQGAQATPAMVRSDGTGIDPGQIRKSSGDGRVCVFVDTRDLTILPGSSGDIPVLMLNRGRVVDHFQVSVQGIPNDWVPSAPPAIKLMLHAQQEVALTIKPPRSPQSRAGSYPIIVRVSSVAVPDQIVDIEVTLIVLPYYEFNSSELDPPQLRSSRSVGITVENHGNAEQTYTLEWKDTANELDFRPSRIQLAVAAGGRRRAGFRAALRRRRWFGSEKVHLFSVTVTSPQAIAQTHNGQVISRGLVPPWLPLLVVVALFAAFYLLSPKSVKVPNVLGLTVDAARDLLVSRNLDAGEVLEEYTDTIEVGRIIRSEPSAGWEVEAGDRIALFVSAGPAEIQVPDVAGLTVEQARAMLVDAGLTAGTTPEEQYDNTIEEGYVIGTSPAAGTLTRRGSRVVLIVSLGRRDVPVPDVAGLTVQDAQDALGRAGLSASQTPEQQYHETVPQGRVIGTKPEAETLIAPGAEVTMVVSLGRPPTAIPTPDVEMPVVDVDHIPKDPDSGDEVAFTATASDKGGLKRIEILVNDQLVLTCSSSPCTYVGGPFPEGYLVTCVARAYDQADNMASGTSSFMIPAVQRYIRVLYPNGGEIIERRTPFTIRWESTGISGNVKIMLKAGTGSGGWFSVVDSTENNGSYRYSGVPDNYGYDRFKIYVIALDGSVEDASDDEFTVPY
jgi:beta-lactam-binding protein with PASTA domain